MIKTLGGEHCVFMKLSCACCDPSMFGLSSPVIKIYQWWTDINFLAFWTFNVQFEFLSLFLHGFETGESIYVLNVANLNLVSKTCSGWQFTTKNMT